MKSAITSLKGLKGYQVNFRCDSVACDGAPDDGRLLFPGRVYITRGPGGRLEYEPMLVHDGRGSDCCPYCGKEGELVSDLAEIERYGRGGGADDGE